MSTQEQTLDVEEIRREVLALPRSRGIYAHLEVDTDGFVADPGNGLCRYGFAGDRLWVRETWAPNEGTSGGVLYRADQKGASSVYGANLRTGKWETVVDRWRSPIHMPRWASRLTLEIVSVRVERLQDISEADARAEGTTRERPEDCDHKRYTCEEVDCYAHRDAYRHRWDQINARRGYSWDANPWVWVLTFRPLPSSDPGPVSLSREEQSHG